MRTALVTGTSRGIGLEYVRQLLARGDRVVATARRPSDALLRLHAAASPGRCLVHTLDVSDDLQIRDLRERLGAELPSLDLLINNAGIYSIRAAAWNPTTTSFEALAPDDLVGVFTVNTVGPLMMARHFADLLERGTRPAIINLSSLLGSVGAKTSGADYAYCASKAALNIATRALAVDLRPRGIIALAMTPGWVRTDMGGSEAALSVEESVRGQLGVIDRLAPSDAGRFVDQDGVDQPW